MIELTILTIVVGALVCVAGGYKLGHAVGFNDGLRRANEIMEYRAGLQENHNE